MTTDPQTPVEELSGRQLDAAVAEEVMGEPAYAVEVSEQGSTYAKWEPTWSGDVSEDDTAQVACPTYSTEIDAAWEVVDEFDGRSLMQVSAAEDDRWRVKLTRYEPEQFARAHHENVKLAICRAALRAVRQ